MYTYTPVSGSREAPAQSVSSDTGANEVGSTGSGVSPQDRDAPLAPRDVLNDEEAQLDSAVVRVRLPAEEKTAEPNRPQVASSESAPTVSTQRRASAASSQNVRRTRPRGYSQLPGDPSEAESVEAKGANGGQKARRKKRGFSGLRRGFLSSQRGSAAPASGALNQAPREAPVRNDVESQSARPAAASAQVSSTGAHRFHGFSALLNHDGGLSNVQLMGFGGHSSLGGGLPVTETQAAQGATAQGPLTVAKVSAAAPLAAVVTQPTEPQPANQPNPAVSAAPVTVPVAEAVPQLPLFTRLTNIQITPVVGRVLGRATDQQVAAERGHRAPGRANAPNVVAARNNRREISSFCNFMFYYFFFAVVVVGLSAGLMALLCSGEDEQNEGAKIGAIGMSILSLPSFVLLRCIISRIDSSNSDVLKSAGFAVAGQFVFAMGLFSGAAALGSVVTDSNIEPGAAAGIGASGVLIAELVACGVYDKCCRQSNS